MLSPDAHAGTVQSPTIGRASTLLFFDKAMLKRRHKPLRGVEIFNLRLLRDLAALGIETTAIVERSWRGRLEAQLSPGAVGGRLRIRTVPSLPAVWMTTPMVELAARRARSDALILGNVAKSLAPTVRRLLRAGVVQRVVLIAHRGAGVKFARRLGGASIDVVAVSQAVADRCRANLPAGTRIGVMYGVADEGLFQPRQAERDADQPVRFCVLGRLDNPWKGADDAVEAFARLPAPVRERAQLHLIAYEKPPERLAATPGVAAHRWMSLEETAERLRHMDCLLVPSTSKETFSQAMVQGMLSGLPIVARDLPVLAEKLDAGGGFVVGSVAEMAQRMEQIARDPALRERLGREARETAIARYVWSTERFVGEWLAPPQIGWGAAGETGGKYARQGSNL